MTCGTALTILTTSPRRTICPVTQQNTSNVRLSQGNYLATGYVTQRARAMPRHAPPCAVFRPAELDMTGIAMTLSSYKTTRAKHW